MKQMLHLLVAMIGAISAGEPSSALEPNTPEEPLAWHILAQTDTDGLLFGLPQRLAQAARSGLPARAPETTRRGEMRLNLEYDGDVVGETVLGLFRDPRWWLEAPVSLHTVPGPGVHVVKELAPGRYFVGAMVGKSEEFAAVSNALPEGCGLGVDIAWPGAIEIRADTTTDVRVRVSNRYRLGFTDANVTRGTFGLERDLDSSKQVRIRSVDANGNPLPFCTVTLAQLVQGNANKVEMFHQLGTDELGLGHYDSVPGSFRATIKAEDYLPDAFAHRFYARSFPEVHEESASPVSLVASDIPVGTATVEGRVHNQFGDPLHEFYLTLSRRTGVAQFDWEMFSIKMPFINEQGRFRITNLPPGAYSAMIRHFDYPTHVYRQAGHAVVIPNEPGAAVKVDFGVEAKELLYGRAEFEDGAPVSNGGWTARFTHDPQNPSGGESFSLGFEQDGQFRVCLSQSERRQVVDNFGGMIEVYARLGENERRTLKIPIDWLSPNPATPKRVVFAGGARIQ